MGDPINGSAEIILLDPEILPTSPINFFAVDGTCAKVYHLSDKHTGWFEAQHCVPSIIARDEPTKVGPLENTDVMEIGQNCQQRNKVDLSEFG